MSEPKFGEWQPIETAPRDGTPILAYGVGCGPAPYAAIAWEPVHESWACCWDNWPLEDYAATHWMPLPEPPE